VATGDGRYSARITIGKVTREFSYAAMVRHLATRPLVGQNFYRFIRSRCGTGDHLSYTEIAREINALAFG
jgi:hypothetical protein